jgi:ribosomal protein S18 acetylase RimI-like enzyme
MAQKEQTEALLTTPIYRTAKAYEAPHLAILLDSASRGLAVWLWGTLRGAGQSVLEVGRERIRTKAAFPSHFGNWTVAEIDGEIAGAFLGYTIPNPYEPGDISDLPELYRPTLELEAIAAGTWYLMVIAVFPEYRGKGLGTAMLHKAQDLARAAGAKRMSIMVESANAGAVKLYLRFGFREWARRPYIAFPGSMDDGDWVLLKKDIAG